MYGKRGSALRYTEAYDLPNSISKRKNPDTTRVFAFYYSIFKQNKVYL